MMTELRLLLLVVVRGWVSPPVLAMPACRIGGSTVATGAEDAGFFVRIHRGEVILRSTQHGLVDVPVTLHVG